MDTIQRKSILFVITKSNWGGAQVYVYALATHLQKKGARVTVALGGTGTPGAETGILAERLKESGVAIIVIPSFMRDVSLGREFHALAEIRAAIRVAHPDIVHLNSPKAGGLGALAARLEGVRTILYTAHGWSYREPRNAIRNALVWLASWCTVFLCDRVIAVSEIDYREAPVCISHRKITVVQNGISPFPLLSKEAARRELAKKNSIPENSFWLLMQAELHKNKGVSVALDALAAIRKTYPDTVLVVLGEGEARATLEAQIATLDLTGHAFLVGFVPNSRTYLSAADIVLMPSYKEGLPLSLLEAGMATVPVIASKTGGIPEIIQDQKNGLLIAPGDRTALTSAITALHEHPETASSYAQALHQTVVTKFSEEQMIAKTITVYTKQ